MSHKFIRVLAAALLVMSANAVADPLRHRAQADRGRTWILEGEGLILEEAGKAPRAIRLAGWQWIVEPYSCPPDIAIGPDGAAVVTSNVLPVLWRIDPRTLAVSVHHLQLDSDNDKDFGFSALVYSKRDGAYFAVSDLGGSVWKIDPNLRRAHKLGLPDRVRVACTSSTLAPMGGSR